MNERRTFGKYLKTSLTVGDFIVLNIAYLVVYLLTGPESGFDSRWVWLIANISFIPSSWFFSTVHENRILFADRVVINACKSASLQLAVMAAMLYFLDLNVGLRASILFYVTFLLMLSLWWLGSRRILKKVRRMGLNFKRAVIIGAGKTGDMVMRELQSDAGYGYRVFGRFDDNVRKLKRNGDLYIGTLDDVPSFVSAHKIDLIYYTLDAEDSDMITRMMNLGDETGAEFVYVPKFDKLLSGQFQPSSVGNLPVMTHTLSPLHFRRNRVIKRIFDLCVSVPFILISPLIFIPIAIGIKMTSKGPVFFKQKRTGIFGSEFICYKFRTMRVNADSDKIQATRYDPRKTRFGDFLRRTSLDELPQFFNVMIGNMSVVGPRPHMISHTEEYSGLIDKYMVRHAVKPGITGWAQVSGYRGGTKHLWQIEKRVEYDMWYIRNWNFFLDVKIMFLTLFNGLRGDNNAY